MAGMQPPGQRNAAESLKSRVLKGAGIIILSRFIVRSVGLINTLIVARLLVPEDFGIVALGVTTMQLLQNLTDVGLAQAIIKFRDTTRKDVDTLFTMAVIRGVFCALLLAAFAPFAADFYGDSRVMVVFFIVALYPLLLGFLNPKFFEFERDLKFSSDLISSVCSKLTAVIISVFIAFVFGSYLALIVGLVAGALVQVFLSYGLKPYLPRFTLASFGKVFGFTGWLTGVSFVAALNNKLDVLLLGRFLGPIGTGNYFLGDQLSELPTREVGEPLARALYPGFSSLQDETEQMRSVFLHGVGALSVTALPAAIGLALVSQELIPFVLGAQWGSVVMIIQILTPAFGIQALLMAIQSFAMSSNKTYFILWREIVYFLIRMPIFIWATLEYGLMGAVASTVFAGGGHFFMNLVVYRAITNRHIFEPVWAVRRSFLAVIAMVLSVLLIGMISSGIPIFLIIIVKVLSGIFTFYTTLWLLWCLEGRPPFVEKDLEAMAGQILGKLGLR